eukprot:4593659-Ditylum_brightwellii.AAC.1
MTRPTKRQRKGDSDITWVEPEPPAASFEKPEALYKYGRVVERDAKSGCCVCTYVWKLKR